MSAADMPENNEETKGIAPDRRSLLRGLSTVGLAAFVAPMAVRPGDPITDLLKGLTGGGNQQPAPSNPSPPQSAPPPAPKVPDYHPKGYTKGGQLGMASDVPVNHGFLYESDGYVVTQPKQGHFVGFSSLCTHEGCPIDQFDTPGEMDCTCHSSRFKITDGKVISGPAKKPIPKKEIIIENGVIYKAKKGK